MQIDVLRLRSVEYSLIFVDKVVRSLEVLTFMLTQPD